MLDEDHGLMGPEFSNLPISASQPDEQLHPSTAPVAEHAPAVVQIENNEDPTAEPVLTEVGALDPSISAVVRHMNEIKRTEKIEEKNLRQYESFATPRCHLTSTQASDCFDPDVGSATFLKHTALKVGTM